MCEGHDPPLEYYQQWLAALEQLAVTMGLVTAEELDRRTGEIAASEKH